MSVGKCVANQNTAKCQYILMYLLDKYIPVVGTRFTQMTYPFDYCTWLVLESRGKPVNTRSRLIKLEK